MKVLMFLVALWVSYASSVCLANGHATVLEKRGLARLAAKACYACQDLGMRLKDYFWRSVVIQTERKIANPIRRVFSEDEVYLPWYYNLYRRYRGNYLISSLGAAYARSFPLDWRSTFGHEINFPIFDFFPYHDISKQARIADNVLLLHNYSKFSVVTNKDDDSITGFIGGREFLLTKVGERVSMLLLDMPMALDGRSHYDTASVVAISEVANAMKKSLVVKPMTDALPESLSNIIASLKHKMLAKIVENRFAIPSETIDGVSFGPSTWPEKMLAKILLAEQHGEVSRGLARNNSAAWYTFLRRIKESNDDVMEGEADLIHAEAGAFVLGADIVGNKLEVSQLGNAGLAVIRDSKVLWQSTAYDDRDESELDRVTIATRIDTPIPQLLQRDTVQLTSGDRVVLVSNSIWSIASAAEIASWIAGKDSKEAATYIKEQARQKLPTISQYDTNQSSFSVIVYDYDPDGLLN